MTKPIFQAVLCNSDRIVLGIVTIPFPLAQDEYGHSIGLLTEHQMGDAVKQDCYVETIISEWPVLKALEGQYVNVDELDYLAKRLDSFDDYEAEQFQATCSALGYRDIKDLINLTFCCQQVTVISDFSKLEEAGNQHYLTIHGGTVPTSELEAVDGKAVAEALLNSGKGVPTSYGLFFRNDMEMKELYQGIGFPLYLWDERLAEVEIKQPSGAESYVFLPTSKLEMERFLQRERIGSLSDCNLKLKPVFRSTARIELSGDMAELQEWNELFKRLNDLAHPQQQKFFAALEVTGAEELGQMQLLVFALDDFDLTPNIADAESYGKHMIQESGKYDYDESLECYYNYEAFGEFLMEHEAGRFTKQGYLKCEEGSAFLDFFTQELEPPILNKTLRDLITQYPDATFHILSPNGYFDFTPEQAQVLLAGGEVLAHPGVAECYTKVEAEMILSQIVIDGKRDGDAFGLLTDYTPRMSQEQKGREAHTVELTMEMGGI